MATCPSPSKVGSSAPGVAEAGRAPAIVSVAATNNELIHRIWILRSLLIDASFSHGRLDREPYSSVARRVKENRTSLNVCARAQVVPLQKPGRAPGTRGELLDRPASARLSEPPSSRTCRDQERDRSGSSRPTPSHTSGWPCSVPPSRAVSRPALVSASP